MMTHQDNLINYKPYYQSQSGSGIGGYQGFQDQRGHGFFTPFASLFQNILKPLGAYLGKKALSTGMDIGGDILNGENLTNSLKKRFKTTGNKIISDAADRAKLFAQTGKGRKRRRRRRKKQKTNKKLLITRKASHKRRSKPKKKNKRKSKKKTYKRKRSKKSLLSDIF